MKNTIIVLIAFLISITTFAQTLGFNYKAVIKDGNGNILINQNIDLQFTILLYGGGLDEIYKETHAPTTDSNGIIILNIGEGLSSLGTFANLNWNLGDYALKTEIDIDDDGTYDLSEEAFFKAVPFARYAFKAGNVSGLEKISETSGTGWRLIGSDPNNFGPIGPGAIDLSTSSTDGSELNGATGGNSIAIGNTNKANGSGSIAIGYANTATLASSVSIGNNAFAKGEGAMAIGQKINAPSYNETVMGSNNTLYTPLGITSWEETDRLFSIGNGENTTNKSDALIILKNGTITAPALALSEITDDKALTTKEYVLAKGSSGLERVTDGNYGWRLKGESDFYHGVLGYNAVDLSIIDGSTTEIGASGFKSFAAGSNTKAIGGNSTAMGKMTIATADSSTAIGKYNTADANGLFMIGNGIDESNRNNALIVRTNGDTEFDGEIQRPNTGNADMIPIAYGTVESDANELSGTGNFSATISSDVITITVDNENLTVFNSACTIVPYGGNPRFSTLTYANNKLEVRVFNSSGILTPTTFQFVLYKL